MLQIPITNNSFCYINVKSSIPKSSQLTLFGKGDPILLISPAQADMNAWEPSILKELSSNHTVIIFDNRGVGNTTAGTKQFSIQQFANDTVGLLDGLKIQKADVLGYSLGSFIAQQLAVTHPDKVNRLVLIATTCGGKEGIPPSHEGQKMFIDVIAISYKLRINLWYHKQLKLMLKEQENIMRVKLARVETG